MQKCKVLSIKKIGKKKTYNLTMKSSQHNYALYDDIDDTQFVISKNSCCYAYLSYITAYLKANYTDEFMCAYLNVENIRKKHDKIEVLQRDIARFGMKLLDKDINTCGVDYKIKCKKDALSGIAQTEIVPSIMCKGVGEEAARELAKHQPYENLRDLAYKTDTRAVDQDTIAALVEDGFYDKAFAKINKGIKRSEKMKKDQFVKAMVDKFSSLRKDILKNKKRGIGPEGLEGIF